MTHPSSYRYAVVFDDPDCGGEYVGYFQDSLEDAQSVLGEVAVNTSGEHECDDEGGYPGGSCPMTIFKLVPIGDDDG